MLPNPSADNCDQHRDIHTADKPLLCFRSLTTAQSRMRSSDIVFAADIITVPCPGVVVALRELLSQRPLVGRSKYFAVSMNDHSLL